MELSKMGQWRYACGILIVTMLACTGLVVADSSATGPSRYTYESTEDKGVRLDIALSHDDLVSGSLRWRGKRFKLEGEWVEEDELAGYVGHETASYLFAIEIDEDHLHLAHYEVDGGRLLLHFNDGSRQLWYRQ